MLRSIRTFIFNNLQDTNSNRTVNKNLPVIYENHSMVSTKAVAIGIVLLQISLSQRDLHRMQLINAYIHAL